MSPVDTPIHWRPDLRAGDTFSGPAIVEEFGSTVPLHPGYTATVDRFGNLLVTATPRDHSQARDPAGTPEEGLGLS